MSKLDVEWAVKELDKFMHLTELVSKAGLAGFTSRGSRAQIQEQAAVTEQILGRVLRPGWARLRPAFDNEERWMRDQVSRGKALLTRQAELREHLGDDAPEMNAGALHPWAWESGKAFWHTGHYHEAVMQAAKRLNAETQSKLGRKDVSEVKLFNEAFSLEPSKPGGSRLRLMADDGSDTYRNLHRGARALAEGLYAAIRNPGMHQLAGPTDQQLALEQLAAFSILARWVDQAKLEA